jgi:hypothetical protein
MYSESEAFNQSKRKRNQGSAHSRLPFHRPVDPVSCLKECGSLARFMQPLLEDRPLEHGALGTKGGENEPTESGLKWKSKYAKFHRKLSLVFRG